MQIFWEFSEKILFFKNFDENSEEKVDLKVENEEKWWFWLIAT